MDQWFDRWVRPEDLTPPQPCELHDGIRKAVLVAGNTAMCGRETVWAQQECPRCCFLDPSGCIVGLFAVWDGHAWRPSDAAAGFRALWLEQERATGLVTEDPPEYVDPDPASPRPDVFSTLWCFRALNPGLSQDEAHLLIESTSIARRPGYHPHHLAPLPYSDIAVLRDLSSGLTTRWLTYHEALWSVLSEEDRERAQSVSWEDFHRLTDYSTRRSRGRLTLVTTYRGWLAPFAERLVAAHRHVTEDLGITGPIGNDRWECHGDQYGQPAEDIALGLSDWVNGRPEWMALARKPE